jgi:hypothetical protein
MSTSDTGIAAGHSTQGAEAQYQQERAAAFADKKTPHPAASVRGGHELVSTLLQPASRGAQAEPRPIARARNLNELEEVI